MDYLRMLTMLVVFLSFGLLGCGESTKPPSVPAEQDADEHEAHEHPTEGPHQGSIIELGDEAYHAELVHDDAAGTVTVYVLDSTAKTVVPIASPDLTINITHEGQGEQFKIIAQPEANDPAGKASRFVSDNKELAEELDHEHAEAQLVISIDGKQFRGAIEHHHEGDHDHVDEH